MIFIYHYLIIILLTLIISKEVTLGIETDDRISTIDSLYYYTLTIPTTMNSKANVLTIKVEDNNTPMGDYSNPSLYISLETQEPKSRSTSSWYSESYGSNIISINKHHVVIGRIFYIGIHCFNVCSYKLKAELKEETLLAEGIVHSYHFTKESSINFIYYHNNTKEESINFAFVSTQMNPFKVYLTNNGSPSSNNTLEVKPSWINGYSINIDKSSPDYCTDCSYRIILESLDMDVDIKIVISLSQGEIKLKYSDQLTDSLNARMFHCYAYPIGLITSSSSMKDNIILTTMLFSGSLIIQLNGYDSIIDMNFLDLPFDNDTILIQSEKVIIITPEDLMKYKAKAKNPNASHIHFCIYSIEATSFNIDIHLASQTESLQRFNAIMISQSIMGYLPKGQVTAYEVMEIIKGDNNKNMTIDLDMIEGESILYAFYSYENHPKIYNNDFIKEHLKNNNFIVSNYTFYGGEIKINNKNNICHEKKTDECALYTIIQCKNNTESSDCLYRLNVQNDHSSHRLTPRTPLTNSLSKDQTHLYAIVIEDDKVNSLTIILNKLSGDSSLYLYQYSNGISDKDMLSYSLNSIFNPNIIQLEKAKSKNNTLKGQYLIKVNATSFASYSIYYYTNYLPGDNTKLSFSDVSLALHTGQILQDYIIDSDSAVPYKVYSYIRTVDDVVNSDIRISLSKRSFKLLLYVYKDLNSFIYEKDDKVNPIKGYIWKGSFNNELVIKATDPQYSIKGPYYIVVYLVKFNVEGMIMGPSMKTFYLGITDDSTDLILNEGLQHSSILNNNCSYQGFSYIHSDLSQAFSLGLNIFYGTLELIIDFSPIILTNLTRDFYYKKEGYESQFITISPTILLNKCLSNTTCNLYFFLHKTTSSSSQYLLIPKSRSNLPITLTHDQFIEGSIQPKEIHYYKIRQANTDIKGGILLVKFKDGNGNVFLSKSLSSSTYRIPIEDYPTIDKYDLIAEDSSEGKILHLPSSSKDKTEQIYLISITGQFLGRDTSIQYAINFANQAKLISVNKPLYSSISTGQSHYYTFNIDDNETKNLHLSLSSTNGDISIYMNYGTHLPSFNTYQWYTSNPIYAFINIDNSDPFFIGNSSPNLKGDYTLMIYAYQNTTYTLHVTTNQKRIMKIGNNQPGNCLCKTNNDTCHFTLNLNNYINTNESDLSIVFNTKFLYGSGDMYVKLYNNSNTDIIKLPTKEDYEFSNILKNKRNFLKINIAKSYPNYHIEKKLSIASITVQCLEKSLLVINTAISSNNLYQYIDSYRENLYFLRKSTTPTFLVAFFGEKFDMNYEIYSHTGTADVQIYQNISRFNGHKIIYDYTHIAQFTLDSKISPYMNTITSSLSNYNTYVNFKITPLTNLGMYIKINYERDWTPIEIGRNIKYQVNKMKLFAYFILQEEYKDIVLNVKCEDKDKIAKVGVKIAMYQTSPNDGELPETNPVQLSPYLDQTTYNYEAETNQLLNFVSIKIDEIPKESRINKSIRVYIIITITSKDKRITPTVLDILVSPRVNLYKRIDTNPYTYYFSNDNVSNKEQTIFDLKINDPSHDMLIIELSSCKGNFDYRIRSKLIYFYEESDNIITTSKESAGRTIIIAHSLVETNYFLSVWAKQSDKNEVEYMMYYYSLNKSNHKLSSIIPILQYTHIGRSNINIILPELIHKDFTGQKRDSGNVTFQVFITSTFSDFNRMESMCFLSKMKSLPQVSYSYDKISNVLNVIGLSHGVQYYMNVMMKNMDTNELFTFQPLPVMIEKGTGMKMWFILLLIIMILLGCGAYYFARKYKTTRQLLEEDATAIIPKSVNELQHMNDYNDKMKYSQLDIEGL